MRRFVPEGTATALLATFLVLISNAETPFDKRLSNDQRILHALNRLTFGPRPGDVEAVHRLGVDKWIALQLHPDRIPENPALEAKLKPLDTLRLDSATILKDYPANPIRFPQPPRLNELVAQDQLRRITGGTAEERQAAITALEPAKRKQVLAQLAPQTLVGLPDLQKEAEAARKDEQAERQKEFRRLMPQLNDLLNPDQVSMAIRGSSEQLTELFAYLDPEKRKQVAAVLPPQSLVDFPELRRQGMRLRQPQQLVFGDLKGGKILRAVYSNRQLEEVLVDFWCNHFNVYEAKLNLRPLLTSYERDAIRPHVLGHFKDLLLATARHPAMLYYLDNWESVSPDIFSIGPFAEPVQAMAQQLSRRAHGLNENYGRELMELHTLGVKGGYTQQDVIEVARCFTGWTIREPATKAEFVFAGFMHDMGEKTVLGHKIPAGGGEQDGLQVIDILARHPSTAKFISTKLAQRFVADEPPQALIERMSQTFTKTDGDLRAVLETMFASPEFFSEGAWQAKIKSPFEIVVSAIRAVGANAADTVALAQKIADLGEPLFGKQEPNGYPETGEIWLGSTSVFGRINFGASLMSGQIPGVKVDGANIDGKDADAITRELLGAEASPQTREAIQKGLEGKEPTSRYIAGLVIGSPDFQKR
jgi:uncharacterized protein (DUF1800 family)